MRINRKRKVKKRKETWATVKGLRWKKEGTLNKKFFSINGNHEGVDIKKTLLTGAIML